MRDLYEILGVDQSASEDEIKRAYRKKARELHPDAGGDETEFKELTTAYEVLNNPEARANYDRYGDPRGPQGMSGGDPFGGFGDLSDLIDAFFGGGFGAAGGGGRRGQRARSGRDAVVDVRLTLEEAASGVQRDIDVEVARSCETCSGSGSAPGSGKVTCRTCNGQGAVQQVANSLFGQMLTTQVCSDCGGSGQRIENPCRDCRGEGRVATKEQVTIDVPAGVDNGQRLRLTGRGEAGRQGAPAGDLYVRIHVRPHEVFERDGHDLHARVEIPITQAALGVELPMPTLDGETTVQVPPGTQPGAVLTIPRAGMPKLGAETARGDLHLHVDVEVPRKLGSEEEQLLRQLAEVRGEHEAATLHDGRGFFDRIREAFGGER
ncbi:molecular chaperone DnaJ [Egibacter rhizosphaerae]|uniref:Chaperone protein DnaJ n=1 Tax=Egibacter rhizosphaerae TaxID=1670831 RepID=A0A411YBT1_9ACTN|nr:molecular chaperone DnaJ [Egibacter rhizosphaerae]QBI18638.1 molecular chaperone DnaJ [Egibacter rhizosphaerae]